MIDGFLNLNKPLGLTSHDCVAQLRRLLNTKKIGHAGTLDPLASGVLPIAIGRATRLLQYLPEGKAYRATVRFGLTTDSDDLEGQVLTQVPVPDLTQAQVMAALPPFQGQIQQVPPRYSAIQVDGKRLYDLARSGQTVTPPTRTVVIHQIDVLDWRSGEFPEIDLAIACGAGTYIRSIARDLGQTVGTGATLAALCRTASSGFALEQSLTLDQLAEQLQLAAQLSDPTTALPLVLPMPALAQLESIVLPDEMAKRWCFGQKVLVEVLLDLPSPLANPQPDTAYRVHNAAQDFLGVTQIEPVETGWRMLPQMVYQPNA
jgi:tRNA pseudouridine55 synthase